MEGGKRIGMTFGIAPPQADGLWYALRILRISRHDWRMWKGLLEQVPEDKRGQARDYLREQLKLLRRK